MALAASCVITSASGCPSRIQAEAGRGDEVDVIGLGWDQPVLKCDTAADEALQWHLLWRADHWRGRDPQPASKNVWDASVTPFVRLPTGSSRFSFDIGIGLHAISHTRINADRDMSTAFQFGEFVGGALRFGASGLYEVSVRVQHISNGGIKHPNDGITYRLLTLSRSF